MALDKAGPGVVLTRGQIAGLAAMRQTAPAFKVEEAFDGEVGSVEVHVEDGRRWLIDMDGRSVKFDAS